MTLRAEDAVRHCFLVCTLVIVALLGVTPRVSAQTLTNTDVLKMVQAKLSDALIISEIKHSTCDFDTSPIALIKLKQAGVSNAVLQAMTEAKPAASGPTGSTPTSTATANIPIPENYGTYAVDHGKLFSLFGGNPSEEPPMQTIGVYSFENNRLKGYSAASLNPGVTFVIFDQASGNLSRGLALFRLPFGRYLKIGGQPRPINGPLAARVQGFRIPLLSKPVPGQSQMVETSPSSPLTPGDYLLFLIRGQQYQAQLIIVGSPQTGRGGPCIDISFPGGFGGMIEIQDYWATHGPPEFPEITVDHYSVCSGGPGIARRAAGSPGRPRISPPVPAPPVRAACSSYSDCLSKGDAALKNQNWPLALADFKKASGMDATKPGAWAGQGMADLPLGKGAAVPPVWDKALERTGTLTLRVWHYAGFHIPRGVFWLNVKAVTFIDSKGKTLFSVPPSQVSALKSHHPPLGGQAWSFGMKVNGHRYWFSFVPLGVKCLSAIQCSSAAGYAQEGVVSNYIVQAIPKLASGALAVSSPPPSQPSAPAPTASGTASTSAASSACGQAVSAGYSIRANSHAYTVEKMTSSTVGQVPLFFDEKGQPVASGTLLHQLEQGAWTHDNIVASDSTRAEVSTKLRALPDIISTSQQLQAYQTIQDVIVRGMAEALEAVVTSGVSLSKAVPNLEWGIVENQMMSSPRTLLTLSAEVGLQDSLQYYKQLADPKMMPPANSAVLDLTTLENIRKLYDQAQALDLPNEALAAALMPTSGQDLTNEALKSLVSEVVPGLPSANEAVTLKGLLDLQKSLAEAGKTLPALQKYDENLTLVLALSAANDRKINTWTTLAGQACTPITNTRAAK